MGLRHCEIAWWGHKSGFNLRSEEVSEAFPSHLCIRDPLLKLCLTCFIKATLCLFSEPGGSISNLLLLTEEVISQSTSPLSFMGKMVALSFSDTHTQMTNSQQKVQVNIL